MYAKVRNSLFALTVATLSATATPLPMIAQALPSAPQSPSLVTVARTLGNSAGTTVIPVQCNAGNSAAPCVLPSTAVGEPTREWPGTITPATRRTIFQNRLLWFGTPNPNPPPLRRENGRILTFTPLERAPGFFKPLRGFLTRARNFEACALGLTLMIGPYGTRTLSLNRGCA